MQIIYILIGVIIGYFLKGNLPTSNKKEGTKIKEEKGILDMDREERRVFFSQQILELLDKSPESRITNDEVQALLDIADSTATKYLQRLEDTGKIKQIGETGQSVYYTKV